MNVIAWCVSWAFLQWVVKFKYGGCAVNFCCKVFNFIRIEMFCKIEDFVTKMKIGAHRVDGPNLKTTLDVGLRVRIGP